MAILQFSTKVSQFSLMSDFYFSWDSNNLLMLNFKVLSFVTFLQCVQRELVPFLTVSGTESDTEENGFGTDLLLLRGLVSLGKLSQTF